jgi:hypothetical protein
MKKTVLAIALAAATMPLTFAAQTPANPPAANAGQKTSTTATKTKTKKHHKKSVKGANKTTANLSKTTPSQK